MAYNFMQSGADNEKWKLDERGITWSGADISLKNLKRAEIIKNPAEGTNGCIQVTAAGKESTFLFTFEEWNNARLAVNFMNTYAGVAPEYILPPSEKSSLSPLSVKTDSASGAGSANGVAGVFKVVGGLLMVVAVIGLFAGTATGGILLGVSLSVGVLVSGFLIYAIGEIVQLLHNIDENTRKGKAK